MYMQIHHCYSSFKNSKELTKQIFGDESGWLPWKRPGFELGLGLKI